MPVDRLWEPAFRPIHLENSVRVLLSSGDVACERGAIGPSKLLSGFVSEGGDLETGLFEKAPEQPAADVSD